MSWFNRDNVEIERDAYTEMLKEAQGLRDDKRRLQIEFDAERAVSRQLLEKNLSLGGENALLKARIMQLETKLEAQKNAAPQPLTRSVIAQKLGIPLRLVNEIDFNRMNVAVQEQPDVRNH